jgi:hypothetical protein
MHIWEVIGAKLLMSICTCRAMHNYAWAGGGRFFCFLPQGVPFAKNERATVQMFRCAAIASYCAVTRKKFHKVQAEKPSPAGSK